MRSPTLPDALQSLIKSSVGVFREEDVCPPRRGPKPPVQSVKEIV